MLDQAPDAITMARLLAVSMKESFDWLHAVPNSSLGLRMDNDTIRVEGWSLPWSSSVQPSCWFSTGRHYCHAALNEIIHRALTTSHIPSRLEPTGLDRSDGKCPDGITMVPWMNRNLLVWDATCSDTLTWHSPLWQQVLSPVRQRTGKTSNTHIWRDTQTYVSPLLPMKYQV